MTSSEEARNEGWVSLCAGWWEHPYFGTVRRERTGWALFPWTSIARYPYRTMRSAMLDARHYRSRKKFGGNRK